MKDGDGYLEAYEPTRAGRAISDFVNDNLSNWYVRLNRRRFWGGGMTEDKLSAYQTLYTCLETVAKLMAPIAPFYADQLFLDLVAVTGRENVDVYKRQVYRHAPGRFPCLELSIPIPDASRTIHLSCWPFPVRSRYRI